MRADSASSVSPARTGTAAWAMIGPESRSGVTKWTVQRSEEHTSELQSQSNLVFRLFFLKAPAPPELSPLPPPAALPFLPPAGPGTAAWAMIGPESRSGVTKWTVQ